MRPDEHKKKKNTQYKKKHGIKSGKNEATETQPDDRKRNASSRRGGKSADGRAREVAAPFGFRSGQSFGQASEKKSDSSDSDTESSDPRGPVYERRTFSRRQIVSNWDKYDLPDQGEQSAASRGEDFSRLLSSAGDAFAQFRFKDERDWEDGPSPAVDNSQIISLDCPSLAKAVDCIPLYRRLGVDKDTFTENQIILQDLEAKKKLDSYYSSPGLPKPSDKEHSDSSPILTDTTGTCSPNLKQKAKGEITLTDLVNSTSTSLDFRKPAPGLCKDGAQRTVNVGNVKVEMEDQTKLDDDLDFLLSLDAPSNKTRTAVSSQDKTGTSNPVTTEAQTKPNSSTKIIPSAAKSGGVKEEDLEDWLDSVLAD
ncbi:cell death regulator Aven-like [Haliotis rufescens]|uniref:cell death regulator Aven-like n=1 Tax=Haliotis rufescens TaxID=6454 RepID=UPI00201F971A|nr:cell death regulator Aven-like [Haliotis rufescens]